MKTKSMITMILFLALLLELSGIVSAQITQITDNMYEDSFPQTAGGYVVWQARIDGDWEIFLYNANDGTGPIQITNNAYDDILPRTDGKYVTWAAGSAPYGEIFIYDIATSITTQLTDNTAFDASPKVYNGQVVWVSKPIGYTMGPGDIFLYDITNKSMYNVSQPVDPDNIYDDYAFRFDGQQILWIQEDSLGNSLTFHYDLATGSIFLWIEEDEEENSIPYLYDLATGATQQLPDGLTLQDNPQVDSDLLVFTSMIDGDREIVLRDRKGKRGGPITANDIEDSQPSISGNILVWKGGKGDDAEIYLYEIPPFYADAGTDLYLGTVHVSQTVLQGIVEGETDGLQYRWMMGSDEVSFWQPVIDGGAPLDLGPLSWLNVGTYTFSLEVTNGNITMNDQMVLIIAIDADNDGITDNLESASFCPFVNDADSDDDGILDGVEDANHNGVVDQGETDPCNPDSDNDAIQDGTEAGFTLDDIGPDTDTSFFQPDADPSKTTDPLLADSDGDGRLDGREDANHNGVVDQGESDPTFFNIWAMPWIELLLLRD